MSMTHVATKLVCPCGSTRYKTILEADRYCVYAWNTQPMEYELLKCRSCGLVRTSPEPPHEEHDIFRDSSFLDAYRANPDLYEHYLAKTVNEIREIKPPPGRFLDVGANIGTQVRLARNAGYDAVGVELNTAACEYAAAQGLNIINAAADHAGLAERSFDVISLSATAEHIPDFDEELGLYHRLLRRGGLLHISNSPNYGGFGAKLEGKLWYGIQPTGHVWQFTPRSLRRVLSRCGFEVISVRKYNLHRDFGPGRKDQLRRRAFRLAESVGLGDALSMGAIRP